MIGVSSSEEARECATLDKLLCFNKRPPLIFFPQPCWTEENPKVPVAALLSRFARHDFDALPIEVQSREIPIAHLNSRGMRVTTDNGDILLEYIK